MQGQSYYLLALNIRRIPSSMYQEGQPTARKSNRSEKHQGPNLKKTIKERSIGQSLGVEGRVLFVFPSFLLSVLPKSYLKVFSKREEREGIFIYF